jgi:DNA end-binding protein Ku
MARAVWSGTISFGLVSVPVRLYPATRRKDVRFHEIDRSSGQRIRHQKVVEAAATPTISGEGGARTMLVPAPKLQPDERRRSAVVLPTPSLPREGGGSYVAAADVLKGFEVAKDRYVTVGREELEELAPERTRTIDVEQFVDASAVDPIYYDISYYAVPERGNERAYTLLVDAMRETRKIALSWFVLRRKRYLAALRPHGRLMVLSTMFHADEIMPAADLEPAQPRDLSKKEREMAALLINTLSGPFEAERYPDEYRQRLKALIEGRTASAQPATREAVTGTGVTDLMAALRASVEQARRASKPRRKPGRKRKTA